MSANYEPTILFYFPLFSLVSNIKAELNRNYKSHIRRPEFKSAPKRMRSSISEELETQTVQKKARTSYSKSSRECLLPKIPKILISCEADSKSSQVRQTKTCLKSSDENLKNARNIYPIFTFTKSTPSSKKPTKMKSPNVKEIISIFENSAKHTNSKPETNTKSNRNEHRTEMKK